MSVEYILVNQTKKEIISFIHMNGSKKRELAGNAPQAAVVTWYLIENQGDLIQFISDTYGEWPFKSGSRDELCSYNDVTLKYIGFLIEEGIIENKGMLYVDKNDPENVYILNLKNVWEE